MHTANWLFLSAQSETQKKEKRRATKLLLQSCQETLRANEEKVKENEERMKENEERMKKLLAERKEATTLAQAQAHRLKQRDEQLDRASQIRAELEREVNGLKGTRSALSKTKVALEEEKSSNAQLRRNMEDLKETLRELKRQKESAAKEHATALQEAFKENAARDCALQTELIRMRNENLRLQGERDGAVEVYRQSTAYETELLRARREGYFKGLAMNVRTFEHFKALDLEIFRANLNDPTLRESAPVDDYAQQWAHVPRDEERAGSEEVDEEIIIEEPGPAKIAAGENPNVPGEGVPQITDVVAPPTGRPDTPLEQARGEPAEEPVPLAVIIPKPTPDMSGFGK